MRLLASIVLLVAGVVLLVFGLQGSDSFASEVKEAIDGTPTDKSIWLIVLGAAFSVAGLFALSSRKLRTT